MSHTSNYPRFQVLALHEDELITKQSHKDECDIHKILSQYKRTGIIAHINSNQPLYADLPDQMDYQDAIEVVRDAQNAFAELPSSVRDKFDNDPMALLQAIGDPSKHDELRELGIMKRLQAADLLPTTAPGPKGTTSPTAKPDGLQQHSFTRLYMLLMTPPPDSGVVSKP